MSREQWRRFLIILTALIPVPAASAQEGSLQTKTLLSAPVTVDRVYKSMQGPIVEQRIDLSTSPEVELLWLKKVALAFVDGSGEVPLPIDHLCHSHILLDKSFLNRTNNEYAIRQSMRGPALFTMIQGQNVIDLPGDLGIPALSNDPLLTSVQVLNLREIDKPFDVRVKTALEYIQDADTAGKMKPVYQTAAILRIPLDEADAELIRNSHHDGCAITTSMASKDGSVEIVPSVNTLMQRPGEPAYSYHWNVPPGKHVYSHDLSPEHIDTRVDTTIHFATVHLHPYGKSVELFDITANRQVLKVTVDNDPDNGGIRAVRHFFSEEGLPLYIDHRYRLIAEYDNPTTEPVDAMAFLYLYLYDKDFDKARKGMAP